MNKYNLMDILSNEIEIEVLDKLMVYKFDGIQIPMIQRDYAQGRENELEIRTKFIKAIFDALEKSSNLELDFIYGSIKEIGEIQLFIPLDGQQRLTTLFLLYWYIGNRELENVNELRKSLSGFTYATRSTARDFCEKLTNIKISYDKQPSKEINEAGWFFSSLKKDPTVKSMLVMLDFLHEHYNTGKINKEKTGEKYNLFENLSKLEFYILPLDGFDLSDELYIKMNARGKPLTDYENYKADLIDWLRCENNPFYDMLNTDVELNRRQMPYYLSFATKLDNNWTNIFWDHSKTNEMQIDKIIDPYFIRFWNRYLLNSLITQSNLSQDSFEKNQLFQKLYGNKGVDSIVKYENFENYKILFEKEGVIILIEKTLDGLSKHYKEIIEIIKPVWNQSDNWSLFNEKITQNQRLLFFSVTRYLELNEYNSEKFKNWIRVIWNIIIDPDIRSVPVMCSVMRIVNKLTVGSDDIYKFLNSEDCLQIIQSEKSFVKSQLEEERKKAGLIINDNSWEEDFIKGENHPLFMGNIGFLLLHDLTHDIYQLRLNNVNYLFNESGANAEFLSNHKLIRALVSNFSDWNDLFKLDIGDNYDNWQLLLRRNTNVKAIICQLCDSENKLKLNDKINNIIISDSNIDGSADTPELSKRIEYIHRNVYFDEKFHTWLQNRGAVKFRKRNDRIYIDKPGSWYDRVMIDTFRNELITELIAKYDLFTTQRCSDSNFYWGMGIELIKKYNDFDVKFIFDHIENLRIGIKDTEEIDKKNVIFSDEDSAIGWIWRKKYNFNKINSLADIGLLIEKVEKDIFDEKNANCLISKSKAAIN